MREVRVVTVAVLLLLSGACADDRARGTATAPVTLLRHFTPEDSASGRYQYVPFEVPPGTAALRISYQYDRAEGDNVIDLGLFEPGSLDLGTPAFRGYSGGARTDVTISAAETTRGYQPGPLPPGQWHVLLGLYKVGNPGVDVTIRIETEAGDALTPTDEPLERPLAPRPSQVVTSRDAVGKAEPRWHMGALHTHTLHSDGSIEPAELMQRFRELRFDFVAITDHNNTTHQYELGPHMVGDRTASIADQGTPLWIVGEEVTTPGGHASVWGLDAGEWVDFRVSAGDPRIKDLVATARGYGAVFSVNHPVSQCLACGWSHEVVDGIDGIEISNGEHGDVQNALAIWDNLLRTGRRITGVGSSDWHRAPNPMDVANVRVYAAALTTSEILDGIRRGRVIIMRSARDATPDIVVHAAGRSARVGDTLTLAPAVPINIDVSAPGLAGGRFVVVSNGERVASGPLDARGHARVEHRAEPGYVRVELHADGMPVAIANPVYVVRP